MAEILVLNPQPGVRPWLRAFAHQLGASGHTVHTPDLLDAAVVANPTDGAGEPCALSSAEFARRAADAADALPRDLVYLGFAAGADPAAQLARTRPGARAAVLLHGPVAPATVDTAWPPEVPLAIHTMDHDPWVDLDAAHTLAEHVPDCQLFLYPGDGHLFIDPDSPDYDESATGLLVDRVLAFLQRV